SEPDRLYVVEQAGRILAIDDGTLSAQAFLDIRSDVASGGEQGLLSVAFHPEYEENHLFYVNYTDLNGDTRVVKFDAQDGGSPQRKRELLNVPAPYSNHNGGDLMFGPDGRVYVGMGDGGGGGDPENRAQNLGSKFGKLLAINVDKRGARWQVVGYGLRNPWRYPFHRKTPNPIIGDVGQNSFEEVDFTPRRSPGLENYGWDVYEGRSRYESKPRNPRGRLVFPITTYPLNGGDCAVTGGFVYRGTSVPAAVGRYFYGDNCSGKIRTLRVVGGRARSAHTESFRLGGISSFGEDGNGELYAVTL